MHQREAFDSTPGLHWGLHCFHASAFTPKKKKRKKKRTEKSLADVKTLNCYWRAATTCEQLRAAPDNSESKTKKLWTQTVHFFSFGSQSACWWSKWSQTVLPTQVIICRAWSVCNIWQCVCARLPAAISSCRISLFWQCLREEHSVRCQVKTICDRFGGENQEKTNRQLNAWEMSRRSDARR